MRAFLVLASVVGLVAVLGWMSCIRRDRVARLGEELRFDDFGFSVSGVEHSKTLGAADALVTAKGQFWIVDLEVANHAQRVSYKLDSHQAVIVDAEGGRFVPSPQGQAALAADKVAELEHGENCVTRLVFDVPDGAQDLRLKICFGKIGTALDYVLLGDWSLALR